MALLSVRLPVAMLIFRTKSVRSTVLEPTGHIKQVGEEAMVHCVEGMTLNQRDILVMRCQDGGMRYYLLFSTLSDEAGRLAEGWRGARLGRQDFREEVERAAFEHLRRFSSPPPRLRLVENKS